MEQQTELRQQITKQQMCMYVRLAAVFVWRLLFMFILFGQRSWKLLATCSNFYFSYQCTRRVVVVEISLI